MPIQEVVKRHPLTSTKVHHRAKNKQFSTLRCTKTGSTQPKLSAACFVVQSCLADADFVVFSNYCLIGTRPSRFALENFHPLRFQWQTKKDSSWHIKGSTNSQQFAWQRSAAMLRFIRISQNAKSHCASCRIFIWKECIIRLHPTTEGVEIPMGGRQKCGNPKKKSAF